jgi:hypothetical protein
VRFRRRAQLDPSQVSISVVARHADTPAVNGVRRGYPVLARMRRV